MVEPKLLEILRTLHAHRVEMIIVGGMAAVIGGAPVVTRDVDILRRRSPENVGRMLSALADLEAIFRGHRRKLRPNASHLEGPGHLLLETRFGVLDVLGTIEEATTYEDVLADTTSVDLGGFDVRVLSLERLLEVKRKLERPKDAIMALQIKAVLDERRKSRSQPFRMIVRDTFRMGATKGTAVTGRIDSGIVRTGDALDIVRGDTIVKARVRGLEISRTIVDAAAAQDEVAIVIDDVEDFWIAKGDLLRGD